MMLYVIHKSLLALQSTNSFLATSYAHGHATNQTKHYNGARDWKSGVISIVILHKILNKGNFNVGDCWLYITTFNTVPE